MGVRQRGAERAGLWAKAFRAGRPWSIQRSEDQRDGGARGAQGLSPQMRQEVGGRGHVHSGKAEEC